MTKKISGNPLRSARACFANERLIGAQRPVLLMVSGGSDSVALLRLAVAATTLEPEAASNPLRVLHVNHLLRGAEAEADASFVAALCAELGVPCSVQRVDVAARAARCGESVEQAGRKTRYELAEAELDAWCAELGTAATEGRIATAHTLDDRAETFLQRLVVGGGGGSLGSIPERNGRIVRPVLSCTRVELRQWLAEQAHKAWEPNAEQAHNTEQGRGAAQTHSAEQAPNTVQAHTAEPPPAWREDATNSDTSFDRAWVRHEVLPLLATRNPRIITGLNHTATILAAESDYLNEQARELLPLTKPAFEAPLPVLRRAVYLAACEAIEQLAPGARVSFEHVELIVQSGGANGFACHLPGGIEARCVQGALVFCKAKPPAHTPPHTPAPHQPPKYA